VPSYGSVSTKQKIVIFYKVKKAISGLGGGDGYDKLQNLNYRSTKIMARSRKILPLVNYNPHSS